MYHYLNSEHIVIGSVGEGYRKSFGFIPFLKLNLMEYLFEWHEPFLKYVPLYHLIK